MLFRYNHPDGDRYWDRNIFVLQLQKPESTGGRGRVGLDLCWDPRVHGARRSDRGRFLEQANELQREAAVCFVFALVLGGCIDVFVSIVGLVM